jgi:pimeloyl-ACP methyl ester carboxylesterase
LWKNRAKFGTTFLDRVFYRSSRSQQWIESYVRTRILSHREGRRTLGDLFYDYRTNVEAYPKWQAWMRAKQPRLLVLWGKYDPSFDLSEPEAYRRDVPSAQVHILDAGHFALDAAAEEIAELVRGFVGASH